jgi:hypothetical protein
MIDSVRTADLIMTSVNNIIPVIQRHPCYRQGRPLPMGQPGQSEQLAPPSPYIKICKKCEALQYCESNEFIELTVGTSRDLLSKAATNNICSNKHKP